MNSNSDPPLNPTTVVPVSEVLDVFYLLEELNGFLHQPMNYEGCQSLNKFLDSGIYSKLRDAYYDIVPSWLPTEELEKIENR